MAWAPLFVAGILRPQYSKRRPALFFAPSLRLHKISTIIQLQPKGQHIVEELLHAFRAGQETGFNFVFREFYAALTYFSFSLVKNKEEAEEIAGDALLKIWERREGFENLASIKSFLYTTVRNASLNKLRQWRREANRANGWMPLQDKSDKEVLHHIIESETYRELLLALNTLPPQCRKIFSMLYIQGKSYQQVARELNLSIATIRSQKARAISLIRQRVAYSLWLVLALEQF